MNQIPEIFRVVPVTNFIVLATVLVCIGILGVLTRKNAIIIFMSVELMLNSVNLLFVTFSSYKSDPAGQVFVFFIMAIAAAEVAVGLAIIVMIYRRIQTTDVSLLNNMKG